MIRKYIFSKCSLIREFSPCCERTSSSSKKTFNVARHQWPIMETTLRTASTFIHSYILHNMLILTWLHSEGSEKPDRSRSMVRVFAVRLLSPWVCRMRPVKTQIRLRVCAVWSDVFTARTRHRVNLLRLRFMKLNALLILKTPTYMIMKDPSDSLFQWHWPTYIFTCNQVFLCLWRAFTSARHSRTYINWWILGGSCLNSGQIKHFFLLFMVVLKPSQVD